MLRLIKPNPRNARQAKAYKELLERRLVSVTKQIATLQDELARTRQEILDPKERNHYCDECGTGYETGYCADRCCDERHP